MTLNMTSVYVPQKGTTAPRVIIQSEDSHSLLWLPYVLLTIFLLGLALTSFCHFHITNKERYIAKRKSRRKSHDKSPNKKHRVTMNRSGAIKTQDFNIVDIACGYKQVEMDKEMFTDEKKMKKAEMSNTMHRMKEGFPKNIYTKHISSNEKYNIPCKAYFNAGYDYHSDKGYPQEVSNGSVYFQNPALECNGTRNHTFQKLKTDKPTVRGNNLVNVYSQYRNPDTNTATVDKSSFNTVSYHKTECRAYSEPDILIHTVPKQYHTSIVSSIDDKSSTKTLNTCPAQKKSGRKDKVRAYTLPNDVLYIQL